MTEDLGKGLHIKAQDEIISKKILNKISGKKETSVSKGKEKVVESETEN
ncbi:5091_t:CDS:2 [Rhizophagus irregularis]|nr:5091_t:CDS:2 [Rhizophagus irregularis]